MGHLTKARLRADGTTATMEKEAIDPATKWLSEHGVGLTPEEVEQARFESALDHLPRSAKRMLDEPVPEEVHADDCVRIDGFSVAFWLLLFGELDDYVVDDDRDPKQDEKSGAVCIARTKVLQAMCPHSRKREMLGKRYRQLEKKERNADLDPEEKEKRKKHAPKMMARRAHKLGRGKCIARTDAIIGKQIHEEAAYADIREILEEAKDADIEAKLERYQYLLWWMEMKKAPEAIITNLLDEVERLARLELAA